MAITGNQGVKLLLCPKPIAPQLRPAPRCIPQELPPQALPHEQQRHMDQLKPMLYTMSVFTEPAGCTKQATQGASTPSPLPPAATIPCLISLLLVSHNRYFLIY